jgi:hypothetical protein
MKLEPRIKVVLAEKKKTQIDIARYILKQTGEDITPKRLKSISNTISRYALCMYTQPIKANSVRAIP